MFRAFSIRGSTRLLLFALLLYFTVGITTAESSHKKLTGTVYEIGSQRQKILYYWEMVLTANEHKPWKSWYRTMDGTVIVSEELSWENGNFKGYSYRRENIEEVASVELKENRLTYEQIMRNSHKKREEKYTENFVTGPLVVPYIQQRWSELMSGGELLVRYGVLNQQASFRFILSHSDDHPLSSNTTSVFMMRAKSGLVGLAVDPIYFYFDSQSRLFLGMTGRMLPVKVENNRILPVDAELIVSYDSLLEN
jgi:hypothetical protein